MKERESEKNERICTMQKKETKKNKGDETRRAGNLNKLMK